MDLTLSVYRVNEFNLLLQRNQQVFDEIYCSDNGEASIDDEVDVFAEVTLLDDARVGKDIFAIAQKNEFEEVTERSLGIL